VLENGYLYIAQPPLFKVKRGKKDIYVKDQNALDSLLLEHAVEGLSVGGQGRTPVSGKPLFNLARSLRQFRAVLSRVDRRCDARIVAAAVRAGITVDTLVKGDQLAEKAKLLESSLAARYPDWLPLEVVVDSPQGGGPASISVKPRLGAAARAGVLDLELTDGSDYRELLSIQDDLASLGPAPYVALDGDEKTELQDGESLQAHLEDRGRKGMTISRYKGLGEMNAEELWETTMNPDARTLLRVRVDDAVQTDELFTILMGDQVEPRRQFIEENALNVRNLDI